MRLRSEEDIVGHVYEFLFKACLYGALRRVCTGLYHMYLECLGILEAKKSGGSRMVLSGLVWSGLVFGVLRFVS